MPIRVQKHVVLPGEQKLSGILTRIVELVDLDDPTVHRGPEVFPPAAFEYSLSLGETRWSLPNDYGEEDSISLDEIVEAYPNMDHSKVFMRMRWEFEPDKEQNG